MPLKARQRSRLAVLAVLALVGSLLAVSAVPVAAEDGKVDAKATYSACVGPAAEDAGFTDTGGNTHEAAINCLAHYGITMGTSEGVYSPSAAVTRAQMALFLHRAAAPAGIDLPAASDQGFTDIGNWSDDVQAAVNLMAELGIMSGRSSTEFMPTDLVTRADMAVHIAEFLSDALVGPGGTDIDSDDFEADDMVFPDINNATKSAYDAIRNLYELGVTSGTTDTTYSPEGLVTRAQMAAFITRAMGHTNARPAGLTVQAKSTDAFTSSTVTFTASIRDSSFMPVIDASVDQFYLVGDDEAFEDDGACTDDVVGASVPCEIDGSDPITGANGNVPSEDIALEIGDDADDVMVWFWTGDIGDEFDEDDDDAVGFDIAVSPAAANIMVTTSNDSMNSMAKFGETATVTVQLVDSANDAVAQSGVKVRIEVVTTKSNGNTTTAGKNHETDANGRISLPFVEQDPDGSDDDDQATVQVTIRRADDTPGDGGFVDADKKALALNFSETVADCTGDDCDSYRHTIAWDDNDSVASTIELSSSRQYVMLPMVETGTKKVSAVVTARVLDQYGDRLTNKPVHLVSTEDVGTHPSRRTTGRFTVTLSVSSTTPASTELFGAYHIVGDLDTLDPCIAPATEGCRSDGDPEDIVKGVSEAYALETDPGSDALRLHWTDEAEPTGSGSSEVLVADKDENVIVIDVSSAPVYVEYDANDHFRVHGVDLDDDGDIDDTDNRAVELAVFEKHLAAGGTLTAWDLTGEVEGRGVATFTFTAASS